MKIRPLVALAILLGAWGDGAAQVPNPADARIVSSDIANFWRAYDRAAQARTLADSMRAFFDEYYVVGSPGLHDFIRRRIGSVLHLIDVIREHPRFYASLREPSLRTSEFAAPIRESFRRFEEIYPDAVFADVYFVIGRMSSGGTTSRDKLLIGTEMFGRTPATPEDELDEWHRAVIKEVKWLPAIVAHELIHVNQHYPRDNRTLLSASIQEGAADFVGILISGGNFNDHVYEWAAPREEELWVEFREEMMGSDASHWLYNAADAGDRPADLGYFMGHQIVKAYYDRATDKREALRRILTIDDFEAFLKESGYAEKFVGR